MARKTRRGVANPVKDQGARKRRTKEMTDRARPAGDRGTGTHPDERGGVTAGGGEEPLRAIALQSEMGELTDPVPLRGETDPIEDWPASARKAVRKAMGGAEGKVGRAAGRTRSGGRGSNRRKARSGGRQRGR